MQIYSEKSKCYGCGKCALTCTVGAITMVRDEEGFVYPAIDKEKCIECGQCELECISHLAGTKEINVREVYACSIKESGILNNSTSGGIFYALAECTLEDKGVVYGAAYNNLRVTHIRVNRKEDLHRLQGSKYVQSDVTIVLEEIKRDVASEKKVLFSGTPCQVAAVRSLIGEKDNLQCVEIACMGCPSPLVWEKYIEQYQKKNGIINDVRFRDKCTGWNGSSISYLCENEKKSFRHNEDVYMQAFGQALFYRPSCHECAFKGGNSLADLKIGDFWGIANYKELYKEKNGVSAVLVHTEKGRKLLQEIMQEIECESFPYKYVLAYNEYFELSKQPSKHRKDFFEGLKFEDDIETLISKCLYKEITEKDVFWYQYPSIENLLRLSLDDYAIRRFFDRNHMNKVAIYGLGDYGQLIVQVLQKAGINITCLIDRNYKRFPEYLFGIKVVGLHQVLEEEYDCIIIALGHSYNNVIELLMVQGVELNKIMSVGSIV